MRNVNRGTPGVHLERTVAGNLTREAQPPGAYADNVGESFQAILVRAEAYADQGIPGRTPDIIDKARRIAEAARAAADAAARMARKGAA